MSVLTWGFLLCGATWFVNPDHAVRELQAESPVVLHTLERTAIAVSAADPLTTPLRWSLGHPPVRAQMASVLARATADANVALTRAVATRGPALTPAPSASGVEGAVAQAATALTHAIARSATASGVSTERHADEPDAETWTHITATLETLKDARLRVAGLALRQLCYLLSELALVVGVIAAGRTLRLSTPGKPMRVSPTPLTSPGSRLASLAAAVEARLHVRLGPVGRALKAEGIPHRLAVDLDRYFQHHARWPGSLKGHDATPGGLRRHSIAVGRVMARLAAGAPAPTRQAAVVLGIIHDLGKTVTYQLTQTGWTGNPASPHDSVSARLIRPLDSFRAAFPGPLHRAILQALRDYHAPEAFAQNAPPLAKQLLEWLQDADRQAIAAAERHDPLHRSQESAS